jgi:predicted NUDIX family NTP pyrophosphohydrolase
MYKWQLNVSTGDHYCRVDEEVQLFRLQGGGFYWARERSGRFDSLRGPVETTPKKAIAALRELRRQAGLLGD